MNRLPATTWAGPSGALILHYNEVDSIGSATTWACPSGALILHYDEGDSVGPATTWACPSGAMILHYDEGDSAGSATIRACPGGALIFTRQKASTDISRTVAPWYEVRMERKRPSFGFWLVVTVMSVAIAYPLSFGPVCSNIDRWHLPRMATFRFYRPLLHNAVESQWPMRQYADLWGLHPSYLFIQNAVLDYAD